MSLVLSICVLFISFMQLGTEEQFLNITFRLLLFAAALSPVEFATDIVPSTCIYASL